MSQKRLGELTGTSQSAIARIESGQENITEDTLERLVVGLNGRFRVAIHPAELAPPANRPWWEAINDPVSSQWSIVRVASRRTAQSEQTIIGLERPLMVMGTRAGLLTEARTSDR